MKKSKLLKSGLVLFFTFAFSLVMLSSVFTALGSEYKTFPVPKECMEQVRKEGNKLHIYDWAEWWPEEIYEGFSKEFGIEIIRDNFASGDEVEAKYKLNPKTPYDVITGLGMRELLHLKSFDAVHEINPDWIPNVIHYIPEEFREMEYDPGWKYSVASDIYFTGYSYNTKYVDDPRIPSWKVLFEPDEKYKGRITLLDNMFEVIGAALVYLGYSPFSDDEGELMEAKEVLLRLKPDVMAYDSWPKRLIMEEEAMISHMWYGDTLAIREDYEYVRGVLPSEGAVMGMDIMLIPIGSPHPATAHLWLNYLFRPEVNTLLLEGIGYSPIHTAVSKLLPEEMLEWMVPPEGYTDKCGLFDPRGYTGKGLELRAAIWEELKR